MAGFAISDRTLTHLDWPTVRELVAQRAVTHEGRARVESTAPSLPVGSIQRHWDSVFPVQGLLDRGYDLPLEALCDLSLILRQVDVGQTLGGVDLLEVKHLLEVTRAVHGFALRMREACAPLHRFAASLQPLPTLREDISRAILAPDGDLADEASPELARLRGAKRSLRMRIERRITEILHSDTLGQYLQDDFFTVRADRYVVPIRLDGRGRVDGNVIDTSESGQTLFIEPPGIASMNQELLDVDLSEKLESIRVLRELSQRVREVSDTVRNNYRELVDLDVLQAQARASNLWRGVPVKIWSVRAESEHGDSTEPGLADMALLDARHPLIGRDGRKVVGNDIVLEGQQRILIVSGPNAGGKTVVLKTVGLCQLLAKAGLTLPMAADSRMPVFDRVLSDLGDAQDLTANLSTFSAHLASLRPILETAGPCDLLLLDELATGTEPQTGAALARAVLEEIAARGATVVATTHFDELKGLAAEDARFRNGSMEFAISSRRPTYRLLLDVPGQSFGLEVAEELGFPAAVIARARALRGTGGQVLDLAVRDLLQQRDVAKAEADRLVHANLEVDAAKDRWLREAEETRRARQKILGDLRDEIVSEINEFKREIEDLAVRMRAAAKAAATQEFSALRERSQAVVRRAQALVAQGNAEDPGGSHGEGALQILENDDVKVGSRVAIRSLGKEGTVVSLGSGAGLGRALEVQVGPLKVRVGPNDWRPLAGQDVLVRESPTNTLSLLGMDREDAEKELLRFLDRAVLRGESAVIIVHGNGEERLKKRVREVLSGRCPYPVSHRPGQGDEGGDGVTIVRFRHG